MLRGLHKELSCHRVIKSDRQIDGYADSVAYKRQLLKMEGNNPCNNPLLFRDIFIN
ncbi:MGMT family protein [Cysteiniphilum marinum]|uniref:MGMT family protein n=1 Tax=Cysteiniphilum marinum TaxID=2774191 RepID=UPI0039A4B349